MKKIALIEDDQFILDFISTQLDKAGYAVSVCSDGALAIEHVLEKQPDLILLDLDLPNVSGREILTDLKAAPETKQTPVIIFSNNNDPDVQKELLTAGASDYCFKAITDPSNLLSLIIKYL